MILSSEPLWFTAVSSNAVIVVVSRGGLSVVEDAARKLCCASRTASGRSKTQTFSCPLRSLLRDHPSAQSPLQPYFAVGENSHTSPTVLRRACADADALLRHDAANVAAETIALFGNDPCWRRPITGRNLAPQVTSQQIPLNHTHGLFFCEAVCSLWSQTQFL